MLIKINKNIIWFSQSLLWFNLIQYHTIISCNVISNIIHFVYQIEHNSIYFQIYLSSKVYSDPLLLAWWPLHSALALNWHKQNGLNVNWGGLKFAEGHVDGHQSRYSARWPEKMISAVGKFGNPPWMSLFIQIQVLLNCFVWFAQKYYLEFWHWIQKTFEKGI